MKHALSRKIYCINTNVVSSIVVSVEADINDLNAAIDDLRKLDAEYGENNKTLLKIWAEMLEKKKRLEAQPSNLHPVFLQALSPFGIR